MSRKPDHEEPQRPSQTLPAEARVSPRPRDPGLSSGAGDALEPGTLVGEYQVTHKLGEGGMGVVYAGMHPEIGKRVAIKVLAPHAAVYPELIRRFKEEARSVNRIRHPNIIDIFAFNQLPDGRHYFVMEYLDGETLTLFLRRGRSDPEAKRQLLGQICGALEAAHAAGVVHRDLKPDNIWIATQSLREPRIKVLDFGIAKLSDVGSSRLTQTGISMGTPHYMPPEQGMGREVDSRADIYALGVILYQMFAGVLPFEGETAQEIVFKHVSELPPPPSRHGAIVPAGMEAIILDCLEKDPARRPATMRELGARIDAAFAAEHGHSPRPFVRTTRMSAPLATTSPTEIASSVSDRSEQRPESVSLDGTDIGLVRRRGSRIAVGVVSTALVIVGVVVFGLGGRRSESEQRSVVAPAGPSARVEPPTPPASAAAATQVAAPPRTATPTAQAPVSTAAEVAAAAPRLAAAATTSPRQEKRQRRPRRQAPQGAASTSPLPQPAAASDKHAPASMKPNCDPNFTLDALGQRHFKPECF